MAFLRTLVTRARALYERSGFILNLRRVWLLILIWAVLANLAVATNRDIFYRLSYLILLVVAAAALLRDGEIVAAAQEERFTRKKNDPDFPTNAIAFCLQHAGLTPADLGTVVFYDKPVLKFARLLETYLAVAPGGWRTFTTGLANWLSEKLDVRKVIREALPDLRKDCPILFTGHHQSHAASAFYPSPFDESAILTIDGVGEWATTTIGLGCGSEIKFLQELRFPHSLGLLYSAFTYYCGFRINSGEYKLMGLAPYGEPRYVDAIFYELIDLLDDGSFRLNLDYFGYLSGTTMTSVMMPIARLSQPMSATGVMSSPPMTTKIAPMIWKKPFSHATMATRVTPRPRG